MDRVVHADGCEGVGHWPRRAPRAELHQAHKLAIGWLCAYVETNPRYAGAPRGQQTRWPDLLFERGGKVSALEIEFTQKTDERLQRIIDAYTYSDFALVTYLTADPGLAAKLTKMIGLQRLTGVRVLPWSRLDDASRAKVRAAVEAARESFV